jgi:hypothetical protein
VAANVHREHIGDDLGDLPDCCKRSIVGVPTKISHPSQSPHFVRKASSAEVASASSVCMAKMQMLAENLEDSLANMTEVAQVSSGYSETHQEPSSSSCHG